MEQTENRRILVVGAAVSVMLASLVGLGVITGRIPLAKPQKPQEAQEPAAKPVEARPALRPERVEATQPCATCGTVESVRVFEPHANKKSVYRVTVRMDDGSYRTISQPAAPGYGVGERVRIIDGSVVPRG